MPESLLNSYAETNQDSDRTISASWDGLLSAYYQTFKTPDDGKSYFLNRARLYVKRSGGSAINCQVEVYAHTGTYGSTGKPTGSVLATSAVLDRDDLADAYTLTDFAFSGANRVQLSPNTAYAVVLKKTSGDTSVVWGCDGSSPAHAGNNGSWDSAAWAYSSTYDMCFYFYGELEELIITAVDHVTTSPAEGTHYYDLNVEVPVTATPDANYYVSDWEVDSVSQESTDNPYTITMDTDHELTIVVSLNPYLTVTAPSNGALSEESGYHDPDSEVEVTATANTGYFLHHWTLDGLNIGYYNPTTITMDADHTIASAFYKRAQFFNNILLKVKKL